jgi:IclR family transcriptional regulator, KDG regulon repressor
MSTTLRKSLIILECLSQSDEPRGISETARELDMDKSAVQRIFQTLQAEGYLEKAPGSSKYRLTLRLWQLGAPIIERHDIRRQIHPILRFGANTSGFTAFLTWADFPSVLYLDKVEGIHGRTYSAEQGRRVPIYKAASGKAILAFLPDVNIPELLANSEGGDGNSGALITELAEIRERLFAVSVSGTVQGVNSVAAPVWRTQGPPVGSVLLTADSSKMPESRFSEFGEIVMSMAEEATRALGGTIRGGVAPVI